MSFKDVFNWEYRQRHRHGLRQCTHPDDSDDKIQPFDISGFVIGLIEITQQAPGVHIVRLEDDGGGKTGNEGDIIDSEIGGEEEDV